MFARFVNGMVRKRVDNLELDVKAYGLITVTCLSISALAFFIKPHDCRSTYGPAPYYYNTDLVLWVHLADEPIKNLGSSILANRPVFAYLGWLFAQPIRVLVSDASVSSPTRASGVASIRIATIGGLLIANVFCFVLTSLFLYHLTYRLSQSKSISLLSALLWSTSSFAFAWSYHPVNQMGGLVLVFGFPLFLLSLSKTSGYKENLLFGLGFGLLLLMKAYYVMPFIYLVWGIINRIRLQPLVAGFASFFIPTLLWRRIFEIITGSRFVDYHLGEMGIIGNLSSSLLTLDGLSKTFHGLVANLVQMPRVVFNPAGLIVAIAALGFYLHPVYRERHRRFFLFSAIYAALFFVFLTFSGFFIPRHGSDFSPLLYPAASIFLYDAFSGIKDRLAVYSLIAAFVLYTLVSYTQAWLCTSQFL